MNELPLEPPAPAGSFLLDRPAACAALARAEPLLSRMAADRTVNQSGVLYVVVMDPAIAPREAAFEQALLHEQGFGKQRENWDFDYAAAARAKARLSWTTGWPSHEIQALRPHLLRAGDSALWGSVVMEGIVVAVSGCEAAYDEAAAGIVALLLRAQAKAAAAARLQGRIVVG